jgi:hypothetical protein
VFGPFAAAFDGARVLVTDFNVDRVSLWKAADLTPLGSFPTGAGSTPTGACSDGVNFWIALATRRHPRPVLAGRPDLRAGAAFRVESVFGVSARVRGSQRCVRSRLFDFNCFSARQSLRPAA